MFLDILKAYIIGLCAAAPLGPIAILVLQKTLSYGRRTGFATAMGSTLVDTTYGVVALFALAAAEEFLDSHTDVILIAGGVILLLVGLGIAFNDPFRKLKPEESGSGTYVKNFIQAILTALSNPGAIFLMLALFSFFNVELEPDGYKVWPMILAVGFGSATWWFFFTWLFSHWRKKLNMGELMLISRVLGIVVAIVGIALLGEGIIKTVF